MNRRLAIQVRDLDKLGTDEYKSVIGAFAGPIEVALGRTAAEDLPKVPQRIADLRRDYPNRDVCVLAGISEKGRPIMDILSEVQEYISELRYFHLEESRAIGNVKDLSKNAPFELCFRTAQYVEKQCAKLASWVRSGKLVLNLSVFALECESRTFESFDNCPILRAVKGADVGISCEQLCWAIARDYGQYLAWFYDPQRQSWYASRCEYFKDIPMAAGIEDHEVYPYARYRAYLRMYTGDMVSHYPSAYTLVAPCGQEFLQFPVEYFTVPIEYFVEDAAISVEDVVAAYP